MFAIVEIADDRPADGLSGRSAERLRDTRDDEACDTRGEDGGGASDRCKGKPRDYDRPAAETVRERPEHELRGGEPHEIERDRKLHASGISGELGCQPGERRHQNVERKRAYARHRDQQRQQPPWGAACLAFSPIPWRWLEQRIGPAAS